MALSYPKRRGFLYSHKSSIILHGTEPLKGVVAGMVSAKIDGRDRPFGNGMLALGVTRGELKIEHSATFEFGSMFEFQAAHPQILTELFDALSHTWSEGSDIGVVDIFDATFEDFEIKSEGTDSIKVEFKGSANRMKVNGRDIIDIASAELSDAEVA